MPPKNMKLQTRRQALYQAIGLAALPLVLATRAILADDDDERRRREAEDKDRDHHAEDKDREHHDGDDRDKR